MYSTEASVYSIAVKQFFYKLKSYTGAYLGLAFLQLLAFVFSLGGTQSSSGNFDGRIDITLKSYSGVIVLTFTFVWAFVFAIIMTTRSYRNMDFTFVSNRLTSNLSNIGFIMASCVLGGITASMYGLVLRVVMYFASDSSGIIGTGFKPPFSTILVGMAAAVLYMILVSGIGYFIGSMTQLNKIFAIVIPACFIGLSFLEVRVQGIGIVKNSLEFFVKETSLAVFALKVLLVSAALFASGTVISNRLEVRG